ncbi:MAG: 50S ribosomal protein L1 [Anaerolineales bacterium]|nr:50S ribosomal protein L1 [Anaerolineales bacterium]MCB0011866.1 50S ribosomal protein L1 [Anaerolineales bacterium]MCB0017864.1 50S ribosomal protein L1 [Anaerolineales bacterium]MCB0028159.1 50S ribosomal protein L1 [Anaerolineales bacterium]MCB8958891.1 50S ribosomal protein L1 [Ardenticatenales bacterium]
MPKHGRKYLEAAAKLDRDKYYSVDEAVSLLKETVTTKFDPTVELHMRLGVDPRHADQQVRDVILLPHGLGKTVRVLVFAEGEDARLAEEAGADYIADAETIARIQGGWVDFDVAMAVPSMMGQVGRLGRILGPRGLMPNPRAGTVAPGADLPRLIQEAKAGRVEFRVDRTANIHAPFGKASFSEEQLRDNLNALIGAIKRARPAAVKGIYVRRITVANTMGPGIRVDETAALADL